MSLYLVKVRHAGQVLDVSVTDNPEEWMEAEGRAWKARYSSGTIDFMDLTPPKRGRHVRPEEHTSE